MNAITKLDGGNTGLMPSNLREAMDLANMMAKGRLVPKDLQGSPSDCLMVIEQAMRWGMSPFAVAQEVSVIQGKMMYGGKIVAAAIHTSGVLEPGTRLAYDYKGEGAGLSVTVTGWLRGEKEPRTVPVDLASAKTNNQHWQKSPQQMLAYHGARVWARRHAPEVMLGVYAPEEFEAPQEPREPRPVQSSVVRSEPPPPSMDEVLQGDQIPDFDPPPPTDRLRKVADRIKERLAAATDQDSYNAVMAHAGIQAEWQKMASTRPELAEEVEQFRQETLDRIASAGLPDVE